MGVFIIAEAGVNHNGDIKLAKQLIDAAVNAKVDAVKFQTWQTDLLVSESAEMAEYQKNNTGVVESQYDMLKRLELSYDDFIELKHYCDKRNILFLSTPDEEKSAKFLNTIQPLFKIGSAELNNIPFLRYIASFKKEVILSTGMGTMDEIERAIKTLISGGLKKEMITVLHVTTQYPTPMNEVNLKAMLTIRDHFGVKVGYSDHTMGIEIPVAAVALGAEVIEKHFTLDKKMSGPDHKASLNPCELSEMVRAIRNIELALGTGIKEPTSSELLNKDIVRKSIVCTNDISIGDVFTEKNIGLRRVVGGKSPHLWDGIIGQISKENYKKGDLI